MYRLRVAMVGQASGPSLIRVGLDRAAIDATAIRAELIAKASAKLGISLPDLNQVRMFLAGGVALTDVTMLDKDDTVYFAWRGEAWREPGSEPRSGAPAAKEPAAVAAEASAVEASAEEAPAREASPVEPASSRPQSSAEELLARRSRDAHRQRDAFRAGQRVHAAQRTYAAAQQHATPRTPHSRLRGREDGEAREGTRHSLPRGAPRAESERDVRAAVPGQLGACGSPSTSWLRAISDAQGLRCTWVCIRAALYCLSAQHKQHTAQRVLAAGQEWEYECKAHVRRHFDLAGQDAAVAGLFGGDWLPHISRGAGPDGHVYGFEPTDAANLSRAVAAANRLSNVHVARSCLSNVSAPLRFCLRRLTAQGRLKGGTSYGDRAHVVPAAPQAGGSTGLSLAGGECEVEQIECRRLDDALPWRTRRVGLLLLDVEGHEEEVGKVTKIDRVTRYVSHATQCFL